MNRRLWMMLLVVASTMPWRVALACAHEAAVIQTRCCCHELRAVCPHVESGVAPCCQAVVAAPGQVADAQADTLPSPDSGPLLPSPSAAFLPESRSLERSAGRVSFYRTGPGTETYLRTARLRL